MKKQVRRITALARAIQWIANNDEPAIEDFDIIREQLTVVMIAEVFQVSVDDIARNIINFRDLAKQEDE